MAMGDQQPGDQQQLSDLSSCLIASQSSGFLRGIQYTREEIGEQGALTVTKVVQII